MPHINVSRSNSVSRSVSFSVYERGLGALAGWMIGAALLVSAPSVRAQPGGDPIVEARDAFGKKDRSRLNAARITASMKAHPLTMWAEYWDLNLRLSELQTPEVEAFYARWPGSYVEDRFRNDWLLEVARRRDWATFAVDFPRFRMNDDREVTCYSLLVAQQSGQNVTEAARAAWLAQREADDGCTLMAGALLEARQFSAADAWRKARFAIDANRPRAAKQAVALINPAAAQSAQEIADSPARYLARKAATKDRAQAELTTLALMRLAASEPDAAATQLTERWERQLPPDLAAWAWAAVGKQSAMKLLPTAGTQFDRAARLAGSVASAGIDWPDEILAWKTRAALRAAEGPRWPQVLQAISAMTPAEQRDPAWVYWKARALQASASAPTKDADALRTQGRDLLESIAGQMNFYGKLATEDLGRSITLPPVPAPFTAEERANAVRNPGLDRGLALIALGLRGEGVREWNFSLRGMTDRELLAAADMACDRQVWDRCINASDRTRVEIDLNTRFPMPYRKELLAKAREIGVDPAYVYGLIRQESRFIIDARSSVGASGLMQVMPATARWTAKKIGLPFTPDLITDRDTNLRIGTSYLKLVLDDFGGSQAMAAAAYNAGPGRPRRWREGPRLEPAIWAENIPFSETRDYVKKVLSNATYYAAILAAESVGPGKTVTPQSLKLRLGKSIGPREASAPISNQDLP